MLNIVYFDHTPEGKHRLDALAEEWGLKRIDKYSKAVARKGDVVFVDGSLGGIARYASNSDLEGKLVLRASAMEIYKKGLGRIGWENVDLLIFHSRHLKEYFVEQFDYLPEEKIKVVPLGIDTDKFTYRKNPSKNFKIGMVSEIHWRKGVQLIPQILKSLPDQYWIYHIGQVVNWDCKNYLDWKLRKLKLQRRYFYQGTTGNVNGWLEDKAYFLNCSYTEGMCRAIGEAMSKGIIPLIHEHRGARKQWPEKYIWSEISEIKDIIKIGEYKPKECRDFIKKNYSIKVTAEKMKEVVCEPLTEAK